jgi:hypothetical protein
MILGRGRRREHPKDTSKGVTTGVAQLPVAHAHIQGNPERIKCGSYPVVMVLVLRYKRGGKNRACAEPTSDQGHFRTVPISVTWLTSLPVKTPHLSKYGAISGCTCAEHSSWQWLTSLPVTSLPVMSLPVTSLPVAPPHSTTSNANWAVPIYYSGLTTWLYRFYLN